MSLSEKLNSVANSSVAKICKIGAILASSTLSIKDKETLKSILSQDINDPKRVSNVDIGKILREEGYDVSNSSVDRHRRNDCSCPRVA